MTQLRFHGSRWAPLRLALALVVCLAAATPSPATVEVNGTIYTAYTYQRYETMRAKKFPPAESSYEVTVPDYQALIPRFSINYEARRDGLGVNGVKVNWQVTASRLNATGQVVDTLSDRGQGRTDKGGFGEIETLVGQILNGEVYLIDYEIRAAGKKPLNELRMKAGINAYRDCTPTETRSCFGDRFSAQAKIGGQQAEVFLPQTNDEQVVFFVPGTDVFVQIQNACDGLGLYAFLAQSTGPQNYEVTVRDHKAGRATNIRGKGQGTGILATCAGIG